MSRRGWVLFALMSVIWGMPYLFIKVADGGVSVPVLVFTRLAVQSSDTLRARQALAVAQALLNEVRMMPFTYCDTQNARGNYSVLAVTAQLSPCAHSAAFAA